MNVIEMPRTRRRPWTDLLRLAAGQGGYFRTEQAAEIGYSVQALSTMLRDGSLERPLRGIYRIAAYPASEDDELIELWLWSRGDGVFSHDTALRRHELSDILPVRVHMTVPRAWRRSSRKTVPGVLLLHYADLPSGDRMWSGPVPITTPPRTLRDVVDEHLDPDLVRQAINDGLARGIFRREHLRGIVIPRRGRPQRRPRVKAGGIA
jgi:predicted transcriptional regulator of viral defense system